MVALELYFWRDQTQKFAYSKTFCGIVNNGVLQIYFLWGAIAQWAPPLVQSSKRITLANGPV